MLPLVELSEGEIESIVGTVPGGAANVQDIYPLAPLQEGIFFHHLLTREGDPYLLRAMQRFDSRSRLDAFFAALQAVIDRHDMLRTAVVWEGLREPVQVVWRHAPLAVEELVLDPADGGVVEQLAAHFDPRHYRLDVQQAPLFHVAVAHDPTSDRWAAVLLYHHLVSDHTALEVIFEEIEAHLRGASAQLPRPLPFRNFVAQARLGVSREEHEAFFRHMLSDVTEPTAPFGLTDVRGDGSEIVETRRALEPSLSKRLREHARSLGVSAGSMCHLAWARVLGALSGRDDVVFGTVLFGRMQGGEGTDRVLGLLINTLPLRVKLGAAGVKESVRHTHHALAELMRHEHAPLSLAQRCSSVAAPAPLFSTLFNYRHIRERDPAAEAQRVWRGIEFLSIEERTNYPLMLSVDDLGTGFALTAQAAASIDAVRICAYMQTALEQLVDALDRAPSTPLKSLTVLPARERHQILVDWNATDAPYPSDRCMHELFEAQVARTPDAVAVVFEETQLTFGELNARSNQLARYLRGTGVGPDTRVALCVERSLEMVVGLLAVLKAGGAYVPLDPSYPLDRLSFMLDDSAPVAVLTHAHVPGTVQELLRGSSVALLDLDQDALRWNALLASNLDRGELTPEHLAYVIYTSGSTGRPKGVMNEHRAVLNRLFWGQATYPLSAGDRVLQKTPFSFDVSVWELFWPLLSGARLVMARPGGHKDPAYLREVIRAQQVTTVQFVPSMLRTFLDDGGAANCSSLQRVICSGEALTGSVVRSFSACFPDVQLSNFYGPTEAAIEVTAWTAPGGGEQHESIPIGRPIANARMYIVDADREPVPIGVAGELYIGGVPVARGYLNRPELTAQRFIASPFIAGERLYKTGDLARYLPDGNIEYLGRNDFQVKIRGFRIELGEIEARLSRYAGIREAAVLAREDVPGETRLVAYYTSRDGEDLSAEALRSHLLGALPENMVPAAYVHLAALPLTPSGKLDRAAFPAPDGSAYAVRAYAPPLGAVEEAIARIWSDMLDVERVGRYDNFFDLGGHSLLAVRALSRIRQELDLDATLADFFEIPTLCGFAAELTTRERSVSAPLTRADRTGPLPLSFAQQRLWFLSRLDSDASHAYRIPLAIRLRGALDRSALKRALDQILARHEALRTTFSVANGTPAQTIAAADCGFSLLEQDLRTQAVDLPAVIAEEDATPFDFASGPLIRGRLLALADEDYVLLITTHHIICDGWSLGILVRELSELYGAYRDGNEDSLPPLDMQYADFALWQRAWFTGDRLQASSDYWRRALTGAPPLLLPADRARSSRPNLAGDSVPVELGAELTSTLRSLSKRHGTTMFMTVLAAWAVLCYRLSGQADFVIGTPVAGRTRAEVEPLIGNFVNTLALRFTFGDAMTVRDALALVKRHVLEAQAQQDLPFEKVVEAVNPSRGLTHSPLFQTMFSWHNNEQYRYQLAGLDVTPLGRPYSSAVFDATLLLGERGERIVGQLQYATELFDEATVGRYVEYLKTLLAEMVIDEDRRLVELQVLRPPEAHRILVEWNATEAPYPSDRCMHELFEEQAARAPDAFAVVFEDEHLSYAELDTRANQLARHLRTIGVAPDTRVALCVERGFEMVVGLLAVLKAGGAYVPLDPSYPLDRLSYMLDDSAPVAVLTHARVADSVQALLQGCGVAVLDLERDASRWAAQPSSDLDRGALTPEHLAYVIYTSGTTGRPKGVMIEHRGLCNVATAQKHLVELDAAVRVLQFASSSFDAFVWETVMALCHGGSLIVSDQKKILAGDALAQIIQKQKITHATLPPAVLSGLSPGAGLESLQTLIAAGDRLTEPLVKAWAPGRRLINAYGPTESTICATAYACDPSVEGNPPIGRPIANTRTYILDAERRPVPIGVAGELYIGGVQIARGYLNRPELTAERFVASPFVAGDRLYKTGDVARYLPDGNIEYLGRNDFQVKIRGFRIELGEIEARLSEHHAIREAVVLARDDVPGEKRLVAYYTSRDGEDAGVEALRSHLFGALPDYMVPAAYVRLEALPLTPNGKLDRQALPAPDRSGQGPDGAGPAGEVEATIAKIWCDLLQLDRVTRDDNFFELGGESLLAVEMISLLGKAGLEVDVEAVFTSRTLEEFARAVTHGNDESDVVPPNLIPSGCKAITPDMLPLMRLTTEEIEQIVAVVPGGAGNIQDVYPLAPLQEGILFHHLLTSEGDPYAARELLAFRDRAELDRYIAAFQTVIDRHDICRTAFAWEGLNEPVQVVFRQAPLMVEEVDIDPAAGDVVGQLAGRFDPRRYRTDVRYAPLVRLAVAHDPKTGGWVALRLSHDLVMDRFSAGLIDGEIKAHLRGENLPEPVPFRNYIARMRTAGSREEHESFFRKMLGDVEEPTTPFGLSKVNNDGVEIAHGHQAVEGALATRLREQARAFGVSLASLCHVAWGRVLAAAAGRDEAVFGTVLFGRTGAKGADRAMGLFINTLPLRVRIGCGSVGEVVRDTHELLAQVMRHEHASLVLAQRCSGVAAPTPLFSALLNYRHSENFAGSFDADHLQEWLRGLESHERRTTGSYYPLMLEIDDLGEALLLTVQVHAAENAKRICGLMYTALEQVAAALESEPAMPMHRIGVLPEHERRQLLVEWNATDAPYPAGPLHARAVRSTGCEESERRRGRG